MKRLRTALKTCIVTHDIVGPIRNGGIGTAYYALALALAQAGHEVTVLYGLGTHCERETIDHWQRVYRKRGIRFVPLPEYAEIDVRGTWAARASARVHLWLKDKSFDVVHFHEWRGIGYYTLLAKRQGLALNNAVLCVGAHSPSFWHKEGMRENPVGVDDYEVDFLERESVALADVVWSPSQHMLDWMKSHGWKEPRQSFVKQYIMLDFLDKPEPERGRRRINELVFFGRLETRKGLDLFCDAMDRLATRGVLPASVTFLGKIATVDEVDSQVYLERRASRWGVTWQVDSSLDRDQALSYLLQGNRLAVLPSRVDNLPLTVLECLGAGIPFVSSNIGGIPEMVAPADAQDVLLPLEAGAWAKALERALKSGIRAARPAIPLADTLAGWLEWHEKAPAVYRASRTGARRATPKVSVCVTHRNRPGLLKQALQSIAKQTYKNVEVVLVDDGSDRPDALDYLRRLKPTFDRRGWKMLSQPNRYPGAARNLAAAHATGEYLLFMDDDNVAKPNEVSTFVQAIQSSGADIVTCFLDVFQGEWPPVKARQGAFRWTFLGGCMPVGVVQNCFGDTNSLIKRGVYKALGGYTEDFGVGFEDWEFLAKATLAGYDLRVVPEALVWYRQTGQGVNSTTAYEKNHMRAIRPYLAHLPPEQRNLVLLAKRQSLAPASSAPAPTPVSPAATPDALKLDHVRQVVVFGTGQGGALAQKLAQACGWKVPYFVDNNMSMWDRQAHGRPVKAPSELKKRNFDLIVVASYAGKQPLFHQLDSMGFSYGRNYVHFLDRVAVGKMQHQVAL